MVSIKQSEMKNRVEKTIYEIMKEYNGKGAYMKKLYLKLLETYPKFNVREYGYTSFTQFIKSMKGLRIKNYYKGNGVKTMGFLAGNATKGQANL